MSYPLVSELAAEGIPVRLTCRMLGHSAQAYYAWLAAPVSQRDLEDPAAGLQGSMGPVASAGDNAAMESWHALLQKNVLDRRRWRTRDELHQAIVLSRHDQSRPLSTDRAAIPEATVTRRGTVA